MAKSKNPEFVELMVKKSSQKDPPAKPAFLMGNPKKDPTLKPDFLDSDVKEIENITKKIQEKVK